MSQLTQATSQTQQQSPNISLIKSNLLQRTAITPIHRPTIQRCSNGVECPTCSQKRLESEGTLQRASVNSTPTNGVPPIVHNVLNSPGQPLDAGTRAFMEPRFGHDFSRVRVHTDTRAAESARSVNALAYTVGRDVVFGTGQYAPGMDEGKNLIAHELTHVVQQNMSSDQSKLEVGQMGDTYEQEADSFSQNIMREHPSHEMIVSESSNLRGLVQRLPYKRLQKWAYGTGAPPHPYYVQVPAPDQKQIERVMLIVSRIVSNPKEFSTCHKFFKNNCPGGTDTTLIEVFNNALLWKDTDPDPTLLGTSIKPHHIAYTKGSFAVSPWAVAASMIHELIHNCGQGDHNIGDQAKTACGKLPDI